MGGGRAGGRAPPGPGRERGVASVVCPSSDARANLFVALFAAADASVGVFGEKIAHDYSKTRFTDDDEDGGARTKHKRQRVIQTMSDGRLARTTTDVG